MALSDEDWRDEQKYVHHVQQRIKSRLDTLHNQVNANRANVREMRRNFWDEVTVNVGEPDDLVETHFSIRQQAEMLAEHERQAAHSQKTAATLSRLYGTPFFGRVDFHEEGTPRSDTDVVYIGLSSFRDDATDTFLVHDWRAPISSLYYDYSPGKVAFQAPGGTISGDMMVKRQYVIRSGNIDVMFDAFVTIGDELLMDALGRHAEPQMRSIVATIQQEQNRVIRNDTSRMLIVQGAAGSGKTSAALQRVAYLLYKHRGTLTASQMVLFSPNPLFNSYVASVLPELGEENLQQTTFQEYLVRRLKRQFAVEDPFDQLEYVLTAKDHPDYDLRLSGIRFKSGYAFSEAIRMYVDSLLKGRMPFRRISFRDQVIVSAEEMRQHFYAYPDSYEMSHRVDRMKKWLQRRIDEFEDAEHDAPWVDEAIELLSDDDYRKAYNKMRRIGAGEGNTFDDHAKERDILAHMVVHRELAKVRRAAERLTFINMFTLYRQFLESIPSQCEVARMACMEQIPDNWPEIAKLTIDRMRDGRLPYEDATPYLYLTELVRGMAVNTAVQHVFIDEAQDYSRLQIEFIKHLFPRSRMTLLGDINQSVYAHTPALSNPNQLVAVYGENHTETIRLAKSYRSTYEIVEFTRGMTPKGEAIVPFERHGEKPKVVQTTPAGHHRALVEQLADLQADGFTSIAVICKTADESQLVHEALKSDYTCSLITKDTAHFRKGMVVIPAYLAKGVEFDAVVIYNASAHAYNQSLERQLFYTACTRAMHVLRILSAGAPSPLIEMQPDHTYRTEIGAV